METNETNQKKSAVGDPSDSQKFVLAIIILIVYLIFIGFMLFKSKIEEPSWSRMLYLFSGIEAIVFAALGYVFGKDIHRIRAEKAEENVEEAKKETDKAKKETDNAKKTAEAEKLKGVKLSTAILARNNSIPVDNSDALKGVFAANAEARDISGEDYLVSLAKSLYITDQPVKVSFRYEISPADKINSIEIGGITKTSSTGRFSNVALLNNDHFSINVSTKTEFVEWTFKITEIVDTTGEDRKQVDGKLVSSSKGAYVWLENL